MGETKDIKRRQCGCTLVLPMRDVKVVVYGRRASRLFLIAVRYMCRPIVYIRLVCVCEWQYDVGEMQSKSEAKGDDGKFEEQFQVTSA